MLAPWFCLPLLAGCDGIIQPWGITSRYVTTHLPNTLYTKTPQSLIYSSTVLLSGFTSLPFN